MSDEKDPRFTENNNENDLDGSSRMDPHRPAMPDRAAPRTMSGRFPSINPGRGAAPQGRFSQSGMPAIPRIAPAAEPAAPAASPAQARGPVIVGNRGGRPGIVAPRGSRPAVHTNAEAAAEKSAQLSDMEEEVISDSDIDVEGAMDALDDIFGGQSSASVSEEANDSVRHDESENEIPDEEIKDEEIKVEENIAEENEEEDSAGSDGDIELIMTEAPEQAPETDASDEDDDEEDEHVEDAETNNAINSASEEIISQDNAVQEEDSDSDDSDDAHHEDDSKSDDIAIEDAADEEEDLDDLIGETAAEKGPAFEIKPIPPELRQEASLRDNGAYRKESRSLLRAQNWTDLVQLMQNVLQYAQWADLPEVRSSILKELAGIYGERLNDPEKEKATYEQLLREDPSSESALSYMEGVLRSNNDFKAIHAMYRRVVDATWESDDRLFYTRKAVEVAERELSKPALVISDWEHLWEIGEHSEEVQSSLMTAYRDHACWEKLAQFISEQSVNWGPIQRLGLREVIEIYISGMGDAERASETLNVLLKDRPRDPLLLLQEINICRINGDVDRLAKLSRIPGLEKNIELDIHRAAADVLWDKGEHELAVEAYDAILQVLPDDRDALHAKEQYFIQSDHHEQLCDFYKMRADVALQKGQQNKAIELLMKAANVAETKLFDNELAISILKKVVELDPNDSDTHRKIIALYEAIGDDAGVAASMEALLALTSRPALRKDLLAKLGSFYLDKLENYERAEDCWKKVQAIDPRNPEVSEELSRVYAKQGDFESLDNSLTQQIRVADADSILQLAETKGRYLMQHSPESAHTAASWEIVLDCDPNNKNALENLSSVLEKLHRESEMIGAWEQELRTLQDRDERISLGLRIADACVDCTSHIQAIAAYLRVLCWEPTSETAITALESLCSDSERGIVIAILEVAATLVEDKAKRCDILKQTLRFIPKENVIERIRIMRRMIVLGNHDIESEFVELCRSEHHSEDLCAAWLRRAYEAEDLEERDRLLSDIARFNVEDLNNSSLSFTILFSAALDSQKAVVLAQELEKLAPQTNRWEEVVAVLGCLTTPQFDVEQRRAAIEKRIDILLNKLDNPRRALEDYCRLLAINPGDEDLLSVIENLANEKGLHEQLLSVYGEIWDASDSTTQRAEISQKRFNIQKNALSHDYEALTELFIAYRFMPTSDVAEKLISETANPAHAPLCVAILESEKRSADNYDIDALKAVADIYENKLASIDGAFALYSAILVTTPSDATALEKLTNWSGDEKRSGRYAQTLRLAASKANRDNDIDTSLSLYRMLANFYKTTLNDLERSVDVERTILHIKPDCIESLDALIAWHESREEWPQLRSELKQHIAAGASDEEKIALWLRVIAISNDYLNDFESAFDGYAEILQIDENNEKAREGIAQLTGADIGPEVELRRLKLELKLADPEKRPDIMMQIANLQNNQLSLPDAACETLENLYKETGPCGIGYEPLKEMYERLKSWPSLVQIMLEHADALMEDEPDEAAIALTMALTLVDEKLHDAQMAVSIVEKLQKLDPDNEEIVERYCSSLRNAEDWPKYAVTIKELAGDINSRSVHKGHLFELARVQALALNDIDAAISTYKAINKFGSVEKNAYFGIATMALRKGDIDLYLNALDQVLHLIDPVWGAIFYCHMAEVCDEKDKPAQVATYYRNARVLDAANVEASDSLRSIGRRLKNWRSTSALLPLENEREMSWSERSKKLVELAQKADSLDQARIWLWKAIAVDHDNVNAWQTLASIEEKAGRLKERYEACMGGYGAIERTTLPGPDVALQNAKHIYEVSQAASACGNDIKAESLLRKAYSMAPNYAPVAMAIGELEQDGGNLEKAFNIYNTILTDDNVKLDEKTKSEVLFKRGLILNIQQDYAHALDDLRATVKMSPLHYDALMTISKTYTQMNQPLLALACLQQSLLVTPDHTKRRGNTYYDMGKLWSDVFNDTDEAGIYYEGALNNGASNVDLVERSLEIYKRAGRCEEALELVDTLTKTTTDPAILASLWCTRGELSESISTENATEAYDMALSYQPGMGRAFDGLERMLVARQEWIQLADLLQGRLESELPKDQEAAILLRLADLYANQLDEESKAVDILYRLLDNAPSAAVIERLLNMPQDDEVKKRSLLEKAILYCSGCYNYALQLAQNHLREGRELQTWAIMSPLRALLQLDPQTKETLNDLKNKFEKAESVPLDSIAKALPILSDEQFALLDAIQLVHSKLGTLGAHNLNEITTGASEVSEATPNGKIFYQMCRGLGLENITLWRAAELPEAIVVVNSDPIVICIRTEIFQKAAGNELQFWLAKSLGLAHPDVRILASTPENYRAALPKAILAAAGIGAVTPETSELVAKIKSCMSEDDLKALNAQLSIIPEDQLIACANTFTRDMMESSDVLGAYIVADMRTVWRAESRIDSNITEQRNVKTVEEISKAIEVSSVLRKVLAYYVSGIFTEHLG
ncbi:MAG: hypothetical protein IJM59_00535 [Proteobacteria bacterium]|nr:hypothetical protein [Pseudomonadota bacterium]